MVRPGLRSMVSNRRQKLIGAFQKLVTAIDTHGRIGRNERALAVLAHDTTS
jgi:hypothetical protein